MLEFISTALAKSIWSRYKTISTRRAGEIQAIADVFGSPEQLVKHYIEPECQAKNPAEDLYDNSPAGMVREGAFNLVNRFLKESNLSDDTDFHGERHLFILSDAGMGKSSLLIMIRLAHLSQFWPTDQKCELLKLGEETMDAVEQLEGKSKTVLLLDALDEDPLAWADTKARLEKILGATSKFRRVIISCRTQFFPEEKENVEQGLGWVKVGPWRCPMVFLSLFDDSRVDAYLHKIYPDKWFDRFLKNSQKTGATRRQEARSVIRGAHSLTFRPLLLAHIPNILQKKNKERVWTDYAIYDELVREWLEREEKRMIEAKTNGPSAESLLEACIAVAEWMQREGRKMISGDELDRLVDIDPLFQGIKKIDVRGRALLNKNSTGHFRFSHYSIQEFLIARGVITHKITGGAPIRCTDQILKFLSASGLCEIRVGLLDITGLNAKSPPSQTSEQQRRASLTFIKGNFSKIRASGANLTRAMLEEADFTGADLSNAKLSDAFLDRSILDGISGEGCMLRNTSLVKSSMKQAKLVNAGFDNANLEGADLSGSDLQGASFRGANLTNANLEGANLEHADLSGAKLTGARLAYSNLKHAKLDRACFSQIELEGVNLVDVIPSMDIEQITLRGVNLESADLSKKTLTKACFDGSNLNACNLNEVRAGEVSMKKCLLERASLRSGFFEGANFAGARLSGAILNRANLCGANLAGAKLDGADLEECMLIGANLESADLSNANCRSAVMTGAHMRACVVSGANFSEAKLNRADLTKVVMVDLDIRGADLSDSMLHEVEIRSLRDGWQSAVFIESGFQDAIVDLDYVNALKFKCKLKGAYQRETDGKIRHII